MIDIENLDKRFCVACFFALALSLAIASSGDFYMALFVFSVNSVLIAGWRSKNEDIFMLSLLIFIGWVINTITYFAMYKFDNLYILDITIRPSFITYFVCFSVHSLIALFAYNFHQNCICILGIIMAFVSVSAIYTGVEMPWRAIGNSTFLLQCLFFVARQLHKKYFKVVKKSDKKHLYKVVNFSVIDNGNRSTISDNRQA